MRKIIFESLVHGPLTEASPGADPAALVEFGAALKRAARRRFGRSLAIREVDAGSCNGCEPEIHAPHKPFYQIERGGLPFVASPPHARVPLVPRPVSENMRDAPELHHLSR